MAGQKEWFKNKGRFKNNGQQAKNNNGQTYLFPSRSGCTTSGGTLPPPVCPSPTVPTTIVPTPPTCLRRRPSNPPRTCRPCSFLGFLRCNRHLASISTCTGTSSTCTPRARQRRCRRVFSPPPCLLHWEHWEHREQWWEKKTPRPEQRPASLFLRGCVARGERRVGQWRGRGRFPDRQTLRQQRQHEQ